ncbi:hypothetical protein QBC47DRAFT_363898 [Echria macrotheca]|uniref:DUF4238 domain-containing protein n=1 Tax=Echria macrotheca TaxID=438768 RepID=A0AAJ0B600_9PEZI|nr:hypothetical protein QBC47DRAFT_363898 [Echria macrotheca]
MEHKQYQHFVPQFLLRNFAHPYKPAGGRKKGGKRRDENGLYFGESVVRNVDLTVDPPVICEKPIKRILGQMNMYENTTKTSKRERNLEQLFSRLEDQASRIFRKITKAYETTQTEQPVRLTRQERDLIRKFLFLLKYRSSGYHKRFYLDAPEDYMLDDRELMREYMAEKGYQHPMDVWYDNIEAIINLEMDPEGKWMKELPKHMYPDDAFGFVAHCQGYYMAICTPSAPDSEFVLTDVSYGIFEGPSTFAKDVNTGKVEGSAHTPLHMFAPVSPKLMIVLRAFVLPDPLEDASDAAVRASREMTRDAVLTSVYGCEVRGLLYDLPIAKARNSYTRVVDGRIERKEGSDGRRKKDDVFFFSIFPIDGDYVNTINSFLLDHLGICTSVVFESADVFAKTLEWFLCDPACKGKIDSGVVDDPRMAAFKKLEVVSRALGSTKETYWPSAVPPDVYDYESYRLGFLEIHRQWKKVAVDGERDIDLRLLANLAGRMRVPMDEAAGPPLPDLFKNYDRLGGNPHAMLVDMQQSARMWVLRVKIDSWSKGVDESIRERNRDLLVDAYLRLPPRRVYLYVKVCRQVMVDGYHSELFGSDSCGDAIGPEDVLTHVHDLVSPESRMSRLVYNAAMVDIQSRLHSWSSDIWDRDALRNPFLLPRIVELIGFVVNKLGYIRECGIPEVENMAKTTQLEILQKGIYRQNQRGGLSILGMFVEEGEIIELLTRTAVRAKFGRLLRDKVKEPLRGKLQVALFDFAYPTPPQEWYS